MKTRKCPKYQPDTEHITYEELERIVRDHQDGDTDATDKLLGAFWKYLHKYINVICYDRVDISDKDIRSFIGLFMPKEKSARIYQFRKNAHARRDLYKAVATIQELFKHYSAEEIRHELIVSLLTLAQRYKSHGNYFHTYVSRAFHFEIYRQLKTLLDSSLLNHNLAYYDEAHEAADGDFANEIIEDARYLVTEPFDEINENWINGLTTSEEYDGLTQTQRRILKLSYVDNMKDEEIADILGVCRATINRRRLKAEKTVEQRLIEQRLLKG